MKDAALVPALVHGPFILVALCHWYWMALVLLAVTDRAVVPPAHWVKLCGSVVMVTEGSTVTLTAVELMLLQPLPEEPTTTR